MWRQMKQIPPVFYYLFWTPKSDFLQKMDVPFKVSDDVETPEIRKKLVFDLQMTSKSKCIES